MFDFEPPRDTATLRSALATQNEEISGYLDQAFTTDEFFAPQAEAWSPAGHMRHLAKSVRPVAQAMGLPKLVLRLRFGGNRKGSRPFEAIRDLYLETLDAGARAGRYGPSSQTPDLEPDAWRELIMSRWRAAGSALDGQIGRWSEKHLDRLQLPHPLMGLFTVREMLYFTLYHNAHHARRIEERRA
ncbi:MAG: DinB family protein [Acidobacteriota bacterium]